MSIEKYRYLRNYKFYADTLEKQCDSVYAESQQRIVTKDSIILIQNHKLAIKDSIIVEKNNTIQQIIKIGDKPSKNTVYLIAISVSEFILLLLSAKH